MCSCYLHIITMRHQKCAMGQPLSPSALPKKKKKKKKIHTFTQVNASDCLQCSTPLIVDPRPFHGIFKQSSVSSLQVVRGLKKASALVMIGHPWQSSNYFLGEALINCSISTDFLQGAHETERVSYIQPASPLKTNDNSLTTMCRPVNTSVDRPFNSAASLYNHGKHACKTFLHTSRHGATRTI